MSVLRRMQHDTIRRVPRTRKTTCLVCAARATRRGWCEMHYRRWLKHGDPHFGDESPRGKPVAERLILQSDRSGGPNRCWPWTGHMAKGYGRIALGTTRERGFAHRASYELAFGPIPEGLTVDHICHNASLCAGGDSCPHRRCINPKHLELVPASENVMRGNWFAAKNARKTHCLRGHPLSGANLSLQLTPGGPQRICRACGRENTRRYRQRKAAA